MSESCRSVEIGRWQPFTEVKLRWEGRPSHPVWLQRASTLVVMAEFLGPQELFDEAWPDIVNSAMVAGSVAGIAAIAAAPLEAFTAFQEAFTTCLASRWPKDAHRVQAGLSLRARREGNWRQGGPPEGAQSLPLLTRKP